MTTPPKPDPSGSSDDSGSALSPEWQQALGAFAEFQRKHRGTRDATIRHHLQVLRRFGEHVSVAGAFVQPNELTPRHIDQFLIGHVRPLGRSQTRKAACSIRAFLRYLAFLGQVPAERPAQVHTPKIYRLAGLPRGLGQDDLHRVLCDVERRDTRGRRQYAMLMLLATYGLRASDVAALRLDDLHWREGLLWIRTVKTGRPLALPLTDAVGNALADYLQHDRPPTDHRQVFVSLRPPFHPLVSLRVSKIVREALDHAGVTAPRGVAAHAFRHSFATRLVRNGVALDVVAKCLDHATSATTEIYTKLSIEDLRTVSLDPRVVLS
jgi:integrase/recombinase XerD